MHKRKRRTKVRKEDARHAFILNKLRKIMATVKQLQDQVAQLATDITAEKSEVSDKVDALSKQVQELKDQIAAGTGITEAQLDPVLEALTAVNAAVKEITVPTA